MESHAPRDETRAAARDVSSVMRVITCHQPARLVVGSGALGECAPYLVESGVRRVLVIAGRTTGALAAPLIDAMRARGHGGLCLGPVNTAAVHALAYPLGGMFGVTHGLGNALLLPHVLDFNLAAAPERYARIAVALGVETAGSALEVAQAGIARCRELILACGLPDGLAAMGIPREAIPDLVASALTVRRLLDNNVRPLTEADATEIYAHAFDGVTAAAVRL